MDFGAEIKWIRKNVVTSRTSGSIKRNASEIYP